MVMVLIVATTWLQVSFMLPIKGKNFYLESKPGTAQCSQLWEFWYLIGVWFPFVQGGLFSFLLWLHQHEYDSFTCIVGCLFGFCWLSNLANLWYELSKWWLMRHLMVLHAGQNLPEICCIDCLNRAKYPCQAHIGYDVVSDSSWIFHY